MKRIFVDAPNDARCKYTITLRDKSKAQCGRRRITGGDYCKQHQKIVSAKSAA